MFKTSTKFILIAISLILFIKCDEYEFPRSPYPRVETLAVSNISSAGVKLNGNIIQLGELDIIEHGFVWGFDKDVTHLFGLEGILNLGATTLQGEFQGDALSGLEADRTYFVKAFVITELNKVYGAPVEFKSNGSTLPEIERFEPMIGTWGDTVTIYGSFFGTTTKTNIVKFGSLEAIVIDANESTIVCIVPDNVDTLFVSVSVQVSGNTSTATNKFELTVLTIDDFYPTSGTFQDEVVITGTNFGNFPLKHTVTFSGHRAEVVEGSRTSLKVKVPLGVELKTNDIKVAVNLQTVTAPSVFTMLAPSITALSKTEGFIDEEIELIGENFNPRLLGNEVFFGGNKATVVSATGQSLIVKVPKGFYPNRIDTILVTVVEQTAISTSTFKLLDVWLKKSAPPIPISTRDGFGINNTGYIFSGNQLYSYDPLANSWTQKANFPGATRSYQRTIEAGGFGYSGLGNTGTGTPMTDFWQYTPTTDSWVRKSDFPYSSSVLLAGLGNKGYAVEGFIDINMLDYDPDSDSWQKIGETLNAMFASYPHQQQAVFKLGDRLFVFLLHYTKINRYLYEFDIASGLWIRRAELMEDTMSGFTINGIAYIKGMRQIHKYDLATNQLAQNAIPLDSKYWNMQFMFTANDKAYFLGREGVGPIELWEFDPAYL